MNCQTCGKQIVPTSLVSEITSGMCIYYKCENCELIKQKTGIYNDIYSVLITGNSWKKPTVKSNDPWDNLKVGDILVQDKAECTVLGIVDELVFTSIGKLEEWGKSFFTKHWFKVNGWTIKDSTPKEEKKEYPLCPRCKTPSVAGAHMTSNDSRSLYCVNGDCNYDVPFEELTTPIIGYKRNSN